MEKLGCSMLLVWMPDNRQWCLTSNCILESHIQKVKLVFLSVYDSNPACFQQAFLISAFQSHKDC